MAATLDDLERWLASLAQSSEATNKALLSIAENTKAAPTPVKNDPTAFDALKKQLANLFGGSFSGQHASITSAITRGFELANQTIGNSISRALAFSNSMKQRGLSGTVEQAKLDYAMEQLSRQFAAVFMPVIQAATYAAGKLERGMRGLGEDGQNRMLGGLLGAGLGYKTMGVRGGLGGLFLGASLMGRGDNSGEGAIGGAILGSRFGIPGAVIGAGAGYVAGKGDYQRIRDAGGNKFQATFGSLGMAVSDLWRSGRNDEGRKKFDEEQSLLGKSILGDRGKRRDVTPFQAEMGDAGSAYFRMQQSMIRVTAGADFEDAGPLKPIVDIGLQIVQLLARIAGVRLAMDSAEAGRVS